MNQDRPAAGTSVASSALTPELIALPSPRHLQEYLTRSQHLHLGYFENPSDPLAQSQERLVQRNLRLLPRNSLVADVGCGLGGTVNVLAAAGHRVYGFDPCPHSIAYARTRVPAGRAQLLVSDLAQFAVRARGARFDALFLVEVLAHFTDLGALFANCRAVLRPGGLLFVHDVVRTTPRPHARGFPARSALRSAADAAGFDELESREITNRVAPTLPRLGRLFAERREEVLRVFAGARPSIVREFDEHVARLRELELGFTRQELAFDTSVLRCSTRLSSDSVVMRVPTRAAATPLTAERQTSQQQQLST
jgi:cyclopropane fatty-acyl-phospholipid synthase-like methyltransferase